MLITLRTSRVNKLDKHAFSSHSSQYISHGTNKEKLNNNPDRLADQFLISLMFD